MWPWWSAGLSQVLELRGVKVLEGNVEAQNLSDHVHWFSSDWPHPSIVDYEDRQALAFVDLVGKCGSGQVVVEGAEVVVVV